jgi:hypothetical protein
MRHTPGPWFADGKDVWNGQNIGSKWVAECLAKSKAEAAANARLIAAAPELYRALSLACKYVAESEDVEEAPMLLRTIKAALKKARGEDQ